MRKVLFLLKTNKFSGAENVTIMIMRLLPKDQYNCVYASPDGEIKKHVESVGLHFYAMKDSSFCAIKKAIHDIQPDIIHAVDYGMSSMAVWVSGNIPVIAHLHNNASWIQKWYNPKNLFFTLSLPHMRRVISVSGAIEQEYCHNHLFHDKNEIIYNAIDINNIRKKALATCDEADYDVIYLGRLSEPKRPLYFCQLIAKIKERKEDLSACMIGDGELRKDVERKILDLRLGDCIKLYGFRDNPYKYVKKGRLLLIPSAYEGFGLAAVEGLSLGKPVLCSGAGGLKDIVNDENGKICQSDDEYIQEIVHLLSDDAYYNKKSQNALRDSRRFDDQDKYIAAICRVYDICLEGRG